MSDFENTVLKMISKLSTNMSELTTNVSEISENMSNFDNRLSNIENKVGTMQSDIDNIQSKINIMQSDINSVQSNINSMQSDINDIVRKTDILELDQNDTQDMLSKLGATVDKRMLPKLDSLYDGYLHNKDVTFRLVTNVDTQSAEDIDVLKKVVQDHSDRINKLESK